MRYVDKDPNHDLYLTRDAEEREPPESESYSEFLDRRLMEEGDLDFPAPYSFSQVLH